MPSSFDNFKFYSIGKLTCLEASNPESSRIFKAYFLWHTKMPKKYFKGPRSFNQNISFKRMKKSKIALGSLLAMAISST
jgi:hypothetical protein